jgi:hypothetical protein
MSPERTGNMPVPLGNGHSLDVSLSRTIDAMSLLREDLRREGIQDLANDLDDLLVKCLTLYVDRENSKATLDPPNKNDGSKTKAE